MEIDETKLPGLGLRHEFEVESGRRIGIVSLKTGERQLVVYDQDDPDTAEICLPITSDEAQVLAELLGAPRVVERLNRLREQVDGLATAGISLDDTSPFVERAMGDAELRTRTGASVVAVVRGDEVTPSPSPSFVFQGHDRVIVVGTDDGVHAAAAILNPS